MNVVRSGHIFSNQSLQYPARPDVPHSPVTRPIPTDSDTVAKKKMIFRPIPPNGRTRNAWTTMAWPTNIKSRTPDGKFGPAKQITNDCWFLAALAAVANDEDGRQILAESIKKVSEENISGYHVTFRGLPEKGIFISDSELDKYLDENGGDADTRLMELAADRYFSEKRGGFKSLFIAANLKWGMTPVEAEKCFEQYCRDSRIDPMTHNPIDGNAPPAISFFLFTGMNADCLMPHRANTMQDFEMMAYLNQHAANHRHGISMTITGVENPLGSGIDAFKLVRRWDLIRTEITSDGTMGPQQQAFLNALVQWLETRSLNDMKALRAAAEKLKLQYTNSILFVDLLDQNQLNMSQEHFNVLRSGAQEVLAGGPGYIGFPGNHSGTVESINQEAGRFTYSEPNSPMVVHTGELAALIQAIRSDTAYLCALEPTTERNDGESSEHAGRKKARHLRQIHLQVVGDGKIDPAESGPLANLMEMDEAAFRHVYDSDKNGVIEGGELKAVQLRVDRWVDHFNLTPIW